MITKCTNFIMYKAVLRPFLLMTQVSVKSMLLSRSMVYILMSLWSVNI